MAASDRTATPDDHDVRCRRCRSLADSVVAAAAELGGEALGCDEIEVALAELAELTDVSAAELAPVYLHFQQCSSCRQAAEADLDALSLFGDTALAMSMYGGARAPLGHREADTDFVELAEVDSENYTVRGELARGGMGRILSARDRRIGRDVALKQVLGSKLDAYSTSGRRSVLNRFEREARITARLEHPAIVPVYEVGRFGPEPFYAMKMVAGEPLDRVIDGVDSHEERIALLPKVITVCEAMAYAHGERVVHRDLKPANILVGTYGETVVIDWGLAKKLDDDDDDDDDPAAAEDVAAEGPIDATQAGAILGTPYYMPPEQASGEAVDARADVYALGAILYHLFAGRPPFAIGPDRPTSLDALLAAVIGVAPTSLRDLAPRVPPDLVTIIETAMAKDPARRFADAGAMAEELRKFETGQLVGTHRYTLRERMVRWVRRNKAAVAVGAVAILVLVIGGAYSLARIGAEQDIAGQERRDRLTETQKRKDAEHERARARQAAERERTLREAATKARAEAKAEAEKARAARDQIADEKKNTEAEKKRAETAARRAEEARQRTEVQKKRAEGLVKELEAERRKLQLSEQQLRTQTRIAREALAKERRVRKALNDLRTKVGKPKSDFP